MLHDKENHEFTDNKSRISIFRFNVVRIPFEKAKTTSLFVPLAIVSESRGAKGNRWIVEVKENTGNNKVHLLCF